MQKLLVIDDEPDVHEAFRLCFRNEYDLTTVSSGREAIEAARADFFPVVILDLELNGESGIDTLQELRALNEFQKVIILTGHASKENAIAAVNHGAYHYLVKPFRFPELSDILAEAFANTADTHRALIERLKSPDALKKLGLTTREAEVVECLISGDSSSEIADKLGISVRTVEKHVEGILAALGVKRRSKIFSRLLYLFHILPHISGT